MDRTEGDREKQKKKNDKILVAAVILPALLAALCFRLYSAGSHPEAAAVVYVDGQRQDSYPLSKDADIMIHGTNRLVIADGRADMTEADCPDKRCVRQPAIGKPGESLVCLPNRIVVTVEGTAEERIDAQAY